MKCFYHTDMDGKCAGAIVRGALGPGDYRSINYKDPFPFDEIEPGQKIVIVDFSLQGDGDFERLLAITPEHRGLLLSSATGFSAYALMLTRERTTRVQEPRGLST